MYVVWIKVDETLPWIELEGEYGSKREAKKAARELLDGAEMKIVAIPQKERQVKALATRH